MKKQTYRLLGFVLLILGTLGVLLPLLPAIPLYVLAISLLSRASKKDIVRLKKLPLLGKRIYTYIKKSLKYLKR